MGGAGGNVFSVNGEVGYVVLSTANIVESSNLYYTDQRVYSNVIQIGYTSNSYINTLIQTKANVSDLTTSNVLEGSNFYFSNARVQSYLGNISGNLIPNGYGLYELGSLQNPWKDLWITGQSLKILSDGQVYTISVVSGAYVFSDGSGNVIFTANSTNKPITSISADLLSNVANFSTSNIAEGSNLYFTNSRSIGSFTAGENLTISSNGLITVSLPDTLTLGGRFEFTSSNNQEVFTGLDNYGNSLSLFQNTTTEVYLNGIRLIPDIDYVSNSTHVTLIEPTTVNENLSVINFIPSNANSEYVRVSDLKAALQDGVGDFNSFKAWILNNL